jgi:hypothetical protein
MLINISVIFYLAGRLFHRKICSGIAGAKWGYSNDATML